MRVRLASTPDGFVATPCASQSSGVLGSLVAADALALLPVASTGEEAGARVRVQLLHLEGLAGSTPDFGWESASQPTPDSSSVSSSRDPGECC